MSKLSSLQNTFVVITGANNGIGYELTKLYSGAGVTVLGLDLKTDHLNLANVESMVFDVTNLEDWKELEKHPLLQTDSLKAKPLSHWYNNAGISGLGEGVLQTESELQKVFDVNFWGVVRGSKLAHKIFKESSHQHRKSLVNIASMSALIPAPMMSAYSASKGAVRNYSLSLQEELKDITVHVVSPGFVKTDILNSHETLRLPDWMLKRASDVTKTAKVITEEVMDGNLEIIPDDNGKNLYKLWRVGPGMARKLSHYLLK